MRLRVSPHPASSGSAGDRVSSCLVSRPSAFPWLKFRLPRSSSSGHASRCVPRVAPASASSGLAGDGYSSCPESRILQHIQRLSLEFPPKLCLWLCLLMPSPGCPGSCIFRLCRRPIFELPRISCPSAPLALLLWVAPRHRTSSGASQCGCELPRPFHLPALPWVCGFELPRILTPLGAG